MTRSPKGHSKTWGCMSACKRLLFLSRKPSVIAPKYLRFVGVLLRPTLTSLPTSGTLSMSAMRLSPSPGPSQQDPSKKSKVLIFGAGNFGSCLADHLGDSQHEVYMWSDGSLFFSQYSSCWTWSARSGSAEPDGCFVVCYTNAGSEVSVTFVASIAR